MNKNVMVRQGDTQACFAACVSTLTGIPFDWFPQDGNVMPLIKMRRDKKFTIFETKDRQPDDITFRDWNRLIKGCGWKFEGSKSWVVGEYAILALAILNYDEDKRLTADGHAVIVDRQGFIHDPAKGMDGMTVLDLLTSCNVEIAGVLNRVPERK